MEQTVAVESFGIKKNPWARLQEWRARNLKDRLDVIETILPDVRRRVNANRTYRNQEIFDQLLAEQKGVIKKLKRLGK
ncbi:MAG: hypothetical protein V4449_01590 [Patescibacteria group bacterium]